MIRKYFLFGLVLLLLVLPGCLGSAQPAGRVLLTLAGHTAAV